jgi:hypothetical protein
MKEPKPGSKEAVALGCTCPVVDNHHGAGFPFHEKDGTIVNAFWIDAACQLHGIKNEPPAPTNNGS